MAGRGSGKGCKGVNDINIPERVSTIMAFAPLWEWLRFNE